MRVDGVEVKVNLEADQLTKALDVLELDDRSRLRIWFYDDLSTGTRLPLLEGGVVLRVRPRVATATATARSSCVPVVAPS